MIKTRNRNKRTVRSTGKEIGVWKSENQHEIKNENTIE